MAWCLALSPWQLFLYLSSRWGDRGVRTGSRGLIWTGQEVENTRSSPNAELDSSSDPDDPRVMVSPVSESRLIGEADYQQGKRALVTCDAVNLLLDLQNLNCSSVLLESVENIIAGSTVTRTLAGAQKGARLALPSNRITRTHSPAVTNQPL
ncbi:hypothetical protein SKAU_G00356710 [Synaphobranchus kaupii]|uniref:Uncharacterized protein n=1 Tax=Synaphobranchus kaupii TaxID=118154 RepID=A0A9Q1EHG9_SYNKA|nr:hypothetical protein SKAU_G00356710 [Synaphobranchus kaupii]